MLYIFLCVILSRAKKCLNQQFWFEVFYCQFLLMLTFVLKPLVGSILDSVALSRRLDIPVVTLPDWSNLHPDHLPFLDQFETIFLWFNNDVQGSQNSRLFAQKIEEKRCRLVSSHYPGPVMSVRRKMDIKVERVS